MRSDDKLILACIDYLGMSPDEAINFVKQFPILASVSVKNAKVESEKINGPCKKKNERSVLFVKDHIEDSETTQTQ